MQKKDAKEEKFLVKGSTLVNLRNYLDKQIAPGYFVEVARERGVLESNMILASSWYPAEKVLELSEAAADVLSLSFKQFTINFSVYLLEQDLNGIFKFLLRLGGVKRVLSSTPRIVKAYNNFLEYEIISNETGSLTIRLAAPSPLFDWEYFSFEGGLRGLLQVFDLELLSIKRASENRLTRLGKPFQEVVLECTYH